MNELEVEFGNSDVVLHEMDNKRDLAKKSFRETINKKEIEPDEFEHLFIPDEENLDFSEVLDEEDRDI